MNTDILLTIIATLALGGIGYLAAEVRRSHNSLTTRIDDLATRLARVEGVLSAVLPAVLPVGRLGGPERDSTPAGS